MRYTKRIALVLSFVMLMTGCSTPSEPAGGSSDASSSEVSTSTSSSTTAAPEESAPVGSLQDRLTAEYDQQQAELLKEWKAELEGASVTPTTATAYYIIPEENEDIELAFVDIYEDVPFVDLEYFVENVMLSLYGSMDSEYTLTADNSEGVITLTRDNGSRAIFDFVENSIYFDDLNLFNKLPFRSAGIDILSSDGFDSEGQPAYFQRTGNVFERTGRAVMIDMDRRFLPMLYRDGKGYVPLQTMNDLFMISNAYSLVYNQKDVFLTIGSGFGALSDLYYSVEPGMRSEDMAVFNYNEMCLMLDLFYGLAEQHDITSFNEMFLESGLYEELVSTDPIVYSQALYKISLGYLADGHTSPRALSHYVGAEASVSTLTQGGYSLDLIDAAMINKPRYAVARMEAYPEGVPGYEEIGNTAYITFDAFLVNQSDYYSEPATADATDTMGLVSYAHSQIMRENSPIENVVIDLSNNSGGQADAAIYVIGWFLGNCNMNFVDTINGGQSSVQYRVDVDLDRQFDDSDSVSSKNLYCMISPNSFSCGNLVPAVFKNSGRVTLIGQPSGGGACTVNQGSTADGTLFSYSSNMRLSTVFNGAYSDIDGGVTPDIPLTKVESFYDREALTDYINSLL